jgi:hypothetical protein
MFAFWQDNRHQLPLGFPALGLPKSARGLLKETILYTIQIFFDNLYLEFTSFLFVSWKVDSTIHLSPCQSSSIMTALKRNQFRDDASSDSLPNGCGWLLDCLSSRGIHVVASSIFRGTNDDIDTSDVGGKFLLRSCMWWCLTDILPSPTYRRGTKNNHAWFKLPVCFNAYFEHVIILSL